MTMTAEDIALQLKLPLTDYFRATVSAGWYINAPTWHSLHVQPSRTVQRTESFRVPAAESRQIAAQLNIMIEAANKLTQ